MASQSDIDTEKKKRFAEIVDVAERVFVQKGFEHASMDEIAAEAHLTKRTVYKYFWSKEDLYFAIVLKQLKGLFLSFDRVTNRGGTGLEKLKRAGMAYHQYLKESPQAFRLINYSQFIRLPVEKSTHYREIIELGAGLFQKFTGFIVAGKADGSIRPDFDQSIGVFSLFLLITGFFFRLSEVGANYSTIYGINPDDLSIFTVDLLMNSISSEMQDVRKS
jgi:AcrR family transcriptional regulator